MEHQEEMELIQRILNGETALFSFFLESYASKVHSLVGQIVSNRQDAEELTQDAFVKAFSKLHTFKGDCKFSTWLFRIAYNTAISAVRKKKIVFPSLDESRINNVPDNDVDFLLDQDENEQLLAKLEKAIDKLDTEDKALLKLFYNEGKSINELAEILQMSVSNVKVKMHRARKKLYLLMNDDNNGTR